MDPTTSTANYLLTQGVLGVAVLVLGWVCVKLYNKAEKLQEANNALQKEKEVIIEARRVESVQTVTDYKDIVRDNTQTNALLAGKIEAVKTNGGR
jgi:hypothetical protein